jgi:hypothetical protein
MNLKSHAPAPCFSVDMHMASATAFAPRAREVLEARFFVDEERLSTRCCGTAARLRPKANDWTMRDAAASPHRAR